MRALVAGVGNELKGDDAFGVRAAARFACDPRRSADCEVQETGIGGIHLVQELMRGYGALILFDAFDRGGPPGSIYLLEPELPDVAAFTERERRDFFADVHYATPVRAMTLAKTIGVLPGFVRIVGCQPDDSENFTDTMHVDVDAAVPQAVDLAFQVIADFTASLDGISAP